MNEGDSAGGGHQGQSPAPPAVPDRRSTTITTFPTSVTPTQANTNFQQIYTQQQDIITHQTNQFSGSAVSSTALNQIQPIHQSMTSTPRIQITTNQLPQTAQPQQQQHHRSLVAQIQQESQLALLSNNHSSNDLRIRWTPSELVRNNNRIIPSSSFITNAGNTTNQAVRTFINSSAIDSTTVSLPVQTAQTNPISTSAQIGSGSIVIPLNNSPQSQVKRLKLDSTPGLLVIPKISTGGSNNNSNNSSAGVGNEINALKKRIIDHKESCIKSIIEKYSEHVAELFFLQSGGVMMDYPVWRKKPPTTQFNNFSKAYRLHSLINEDIKQTTPSQPVISSSSSSSSSSNHSSTIVSTTIPEGAEIKIPGFGATPVAISKTLPAAVVQLSQLGHIPGRPLGGRHGMVFGHIPVPPAVRNSSVPLLPGGTPLVPDLTNNLTDTTDKHKTQTTVKSSDVSTANVIHTAAATSSTSSLSSTASTPIPLTVTTYQQPNSAPPTLGNGVQEFSVKAKQEVFVMQRISELQREGLWTEKRLPKLQEPARPKAHWDYLLEEMVWLAADFAQERKWKKNAAKKCCRMIQKYFHDKQNAAQKAEKAHELHLKRVAAFAAKEVKMFWSNVEKLVEYKHHTKLEEKRKRALDQHLSFIVDQTEKFSQQLVEGMNKTAVDNSAGPSLNSSRKSSPKRDHLGSDDEFRPVEISDDDEETIAKAEEEGVDVNEEIAALKIESEMNLDDFLKELPKDYLENRDKIVLDDDSRFSSVDENEDKEFEANEASSDDENTIMEQEKAERNVDHKKEIEKLNADAEMSIDELRAKYNSNSTRKVTVMEVDSDDETDDDESQQSIDSDDETENSDEETAEEATENSGSEEENEDQTGLKSLLEEHKQEGSQTENKDDLINDAAALAESIQPKGNTLSSTNVVTPVPFLLKHTLREYQHIGLDWLVTMHDRKLNGILADEMGLGKTIQTIALLAHLACVKGCWGPHLIVVPSSVMLNWEMEFKKWCPGFKILTYYGTQKERKMKRVGWTKVNAFHVCITSYKLVIQDQQSFRRKKWKYLILDEAQNIKNFKSQRWQLLLNFSTEQRLLLTGTPLQNNLMELWSLMHFLMPHVFQSHREFKEWFSNPVTGMIEGNSEYNESLIKRLHKVLRPFLLRRLKSEVEKQMPKKYEHVVMCRLSNRQRYLYEDFMSRAKTRETLSSGNLLSVINVLMQLRKVCNHPNLFEVRPTISPFQMECISFQTAGLACNVMEYDPFTQIDLNSLNLHLLQLELCLTAYVSYKSRKLSTPRVLIEEIDSLPPPPPRCPSGQYKLYVRVKESNVQENLTSHLSGVQVGTSPAMKTEGNKLVPIVNLDQKVKKFASINQVQQIKSTSLLPSRALQNSNSNSTPQIAQIVQTTTGRHIVLTSGCPAQRITVVGKSLAAGKSIASCSSAFKPARKVEVADKNVIKALAQELKASKVANSIEKPIKAKADEEKVDVDFYSPERIQQQKERRQATLNLMARINHRRCDAVPIYGEDCRSAIEIMSTPCRSPNFSTWQSRSYINCQTAMMRRDNWALTHLIKSYEERTKSMAEIFNNFVVYVPPVSSSRSYLQAQHIHPSKINNEEISKTTIHEYMSPKLTLLQPIISAMCTQFPDPRLIQYDCGKLQTLNHLLRKLKSESHRVLIFTQMTKMLDVLEAFLNYHGHIYLRLDGSTKIEQRQILMERFNGDKRIFVFILSTRSGGVGINLTGADTVIFYDSDWNPTMDAQAQDRCHRIGQTRDVHIYRLVSEKTIEENILKKANQKRMLGDLAIEGGNFTTAFFKGTTIKDLFNVQQDGDASSRLAEVVEQNNERKQMLEQHSSTSTAGYGAITVEEKSSIGAFESALAAAEDEQDVQAAKIAKAEAAADLDEFDENIPIDDIEKPLTEMSKADQELENLVKQLSPIERYAMKFVEETGDSWTAEQLRVAEEEIEAQKREWEANRLAALQKEEEILNAEATEDDMLTYSREDAKNQVKTTKNSKKIIKRNKIVVNKRGKTIKQQSNRNTRLATKNNLRSKARTIRSRVKVVDVLDVVDVVDEVNNIHDLTDNEHENVDGEDSDVYGDDNEDDGDGGNDDDGDGGNNDDSNSDHSCEDDHICSGSENNEHSKRLTSKSTPSKTVKCETVLQRKLFRGKVRPAPVKRNLRTTTNGGSAYVSDNISILNCNSLDETARLYDKQKRKNNLSVEKNTNTKRIKMSPGKKNQTSSPKKQKGKLIEIETIVGVTTEDSNAIREDGDKKINGNEKKVGTIRKVEESNEYSLDVMVDSTTNSSLLYNSEHEEEVSLTNENDDDSDGETDTDVNSTIQNSIQTNQIDVNSPRTRSRGSVKINLWTLDVSPILPGVRSISKTNRKDKQRDSDMDEEIDSITVRNINENKVDFEENPLKITSISTPKQLAPLFNSKNKTNKCNRSVKKSLGSINSNGEKPTSTLDNWIMKTPKVVLTAIDYEYGNTSKRMPKDSVASGSSVYPVRMTRRFSLMKAAPENGGPS